MFVWLCMCMSLVPVRVHTQYTPTTTLHSVLGHVFFRVKREKRGQPQRFGRRGGGIFFLNSSRHQHDLSTCAVAYTYKVKLANKGGGTGGCSGHCTLLILVTSSLYCRFCCIEIQFPSSSPPTLFYFRLFPSLCLLFLLGCFSITSLSTYFLNRLRN